MKRRAALTALALTTAWTLGCVEVSGPVVDGGNWPEWPEWPEWPVGQTFEWRGHIDQGDQIEIKGVFGDIHATSAPGNQTVVSATKAGPADKLAEVAIEIVPHAGGVTICAVYPDVPGQRRNECAAGDGGNVSVRDSAANAVRVTFTVQVPEGVDLTGRTIAGDVEAFDMKSDAFLMTVAGDARVSTTGIATAQTVGGSVIASIGDADWDRDLAFASVAGDISVSIPSNTNARVEASAANGSIMSDFPLTQVAQGKMQGVIGNGGPKLSLSTVSGDVRLLRR